MRNVFYRFAVWLSAFINAFVFTHAHAQGAPNDLSTHLIAYSDHLNLKYFIIIPDRSGQNWCLPEMIIRVVADGQSFSVTDEFLETTQRVGSLLAEKCDRVEKAFIYVVDRNEKPTKTL